ncbi:hypothetical protein C8R41DRAFT_919994 [Lentinula lateritia]|uniref:Uncharacterized protein n=1 Tax=Lentinula lateritia TaxID=40482 RepID=A0ABQ8VKR4_9AGAR|nr:hypothetical protein C8R41DRAFT_919994 [Lentinula lateritia]
MRWNSQGKNSQVCKLPHCQPGGAANKVHHGAVKNGSKRAEPSTPTELPGQQPLNALRQRRRLCAAQLAQNQKEPGLPRASTQDPRNEVAAPWLDLKSATPRRPWDNFAREKPGRSTRRFLVVDRTFGGAVEVAGKKPRKAPKGRLHTCFESRATPTATPPVPPPPPATAPPTLLSHSHTHALPLQSSTTSPPTSSTTTSTSDVPTSAAPSSTSDTDSSTSTTSSASVLTAPVTTVVRTTVVSTSNGQTFTTVFSTESVAPAGSTITVGSDSTDITNSTSHTGAIVGGVVGGVVALLLLILGALWFIRRRRRLQDEAFDGNFDPNRIVRPASGAGNLGGRGPTLPNIPVTNSDEHIGAGSPQMAEVEDDGMGGRLNGSAIGAGVVAPYPLHQPTTSPTRSAASPPPSARSWGNSSDAQHSLYNGHVADWRGPSPGPSIPTQYTGGSGSAVPPSWYSHGMIANLPPGASPGPAGPGTPSSAHAYPGATATHGRRYSAGTSASSGDRQPLYAAAATGSASSSTGGGSVQNGGRVAAGKEDALTNTTGMEEPSGQVTGWLFIPGSV